MSFSTPIDALVEPFTLLDHFNISDEYLQQPQTSQHNYLSWPTMEASTTGLLDAVPEMASLGIINGFGISNHPRSRVNEAMDLPAKTRKPKAPTLKDADWAPHKDLIIDLHITQQKPLKWVRAYMEKEHMFRAAYEPSRDLQGA
jgi:hypothetical protein